MLRLWNKSWNIGDILFLNTRHQFILCIFIFRSVWLMGSSSSSSASQKTGNSAREVKTKWRTWREKTFTFASCNIIIGMFQWNDKTHRNRRMEISLSRSSFNHRFFHSHSVADVSSVCNHQIRSSARSSFRNTEWHEQTHGCWVLFSSALCKSDNVLTEHVDLPSELLWKSLTHGAFCCCGVRTFSYPTATGTLSICGPTHVLPPQ